MKKEMYAIDEMQEEGLEFLKMANVPENYFHLFGNDSNGNPVLDYEFFLLMDSDLKDMFVRRLCRLFDDKNSNACDPGKKSIVYQASVGYINQSDFWDEVEKVVKVMLHLNSKTRETMGRGFLNEFIDTRKPGWEKEGYRVLYALHVYMPAYYTFLTHTLKECIV